jgi:hypothetical protein
MDMYESFANRRVDTRVATGPYAEAMDNASEIELDHAYMIDTNTQPLNMSRDLSDEELIEDEGWKRASQTVYEAFMSGRNLKGRNKARGASQPSTPDEYGAWGLEFIGQMNHNFTSMAVNVNKLRDMDVNTAYAMHHLFGEYERLPDFSWNGTKRFFKGVATDPTTYIGLGTLGLATIGTAGAKQMGKGAFRQTLRGMLDPRMLAVYEGAGYVGVDTALRQNVDIQAGVSGEYDIEEILRNAGIGGALGGGVAQLGKVVADNAPAVAGAIREGIAELGAGADQRIAERGADSSTTLTSGVDPTPAIDAALSYAGRKVRKDGQVVGAPPGIDSQEALDKMRRNLEAAAAEGEPGRFWYERSGQAILDALGGDKAEAEKLAQAIAITSSATGVKGNFDFALQAYLQHKAGQPVKTGRFPAAMSKKIQAVFDGTDWEGRKTNNFYVNLMRVIDPSKVQGVTTDMWMMRAFGFKNADGTPYSGTPTDAQYTFVEEETKRIADQLGWEPQQVQAAIWVSNKARDEGTDVSAAAFDYSDALLNNKAQISWESIPGRTGNHMPEMFDAPYEVQQEYHVAISKAFLDENGNDFVAKELGIPTPGDFEAPGYFEGKVSPGTQTELAIPKEYKGPKTGAVEPAALELMKTYAAIRGIAMKQDGVGYHRPFFNPTKANANGIELQIGRSFSEGETDRLAKILARLSGHGEYNPIATRGGVRLINFDFLEFDNKEFTKMVQTAIDELDMDDDITIGQKLFHAQNDYASNDWSVSKNGEEYTADLRGEGRPDLQRKIRSIITRLQARVDEVDADFSDRYGFTRNLELNDAFRGSQ